MYQSRHFPVPTDTPGWDILKTGSGPRQVAITIDFPTPFGTTPEVQAFIAGFDIDSSVNARLRVEVKNVQPDKFVLVIETWADSRVYAVDVVWIAHD